MRRFILLLAAVSLLFGGFFTAPVAAKGKKYKTIYIVAIVPEGTGDVYITGSDKMMGPWSPGKIKMYKDGNKRIYAIEAKKGYQLEYKFTLGSWESEAVNKNRVPFANFRLTVKDKQVHSHIIPGFKGQ